MRIFNKLNKIAVLLIVFIIYISTNNLVLFAENSKSNIDYQALFKEANNFYKSDNFIGALEKYEKIYNSGYKSSELLYNIGNTYYRLGNYPKAILFYERTKKLTPNDNDLNINLNLANAKIVDKIQVIEPFFIYSWAKNIRDVFSSNTWALLFIIFLFIVCGVYTLRLYSQVPSRRRKILSASGVVSILLCIFSLTIGVLRLKAENSNANAIIMQSTIDIKLSNDPASEIAFTLHEGTKVQILEFQESNYKIKIADGRQGWLPTNMVEVI